MTTPYLMTRKMMTCEFKILIISDRAVVNFLGKVGLLLKTSITVSSFKKQHET